MKRLPKYTPAEVRNDPYGFTYKEMSEVIGENEAKALYEELYKQSRLYNFYKCQHCCRINCFKAFITTLDFMLVSIFLTKVA